MPKSALENTPAPPAESTARLRQIGFLPLLALFYGYTAGGPFGYEEIFHSSGPGMAIVFLAFVPLFWSIPISLAAAELNSLLPVKAASIAGVAPRSAISGDFNAAGGIGPARFF
jgi:hypothetical protein